MRLARLLERRLSAATIALLLAGGAAHGGFAAASPVDFNRHILPLLADRCFACHGPDAAARAADLRLDQPESAVAPGGDGPFVPFRPEASAALLRMEADDPDLRMPPPTSGKRLTAEEIARVRAWIAQGAAWEQHWSLVAPPHGPPSAGAGSAREHPIDGPLRKELQRAGLDFSPQADRRTLIRRLSFDLRGLPPTPVEAADFAADQAPDAYERLVDRWLASPQFGERMAMHWLDLVRYADSIGYHSDNPQPVSAYRDYVIEAFNANLPFDQFTIENLAGDLLPGRTRSQWAASGYNRLLQTTEEGGAQAAEYVAKYAADRVRNLSSVWLGATLGCAECHDHKYDPYTMRDFYALAAFFADIQELAVGEREAVSLPTAEQAEQIAEHDRQIAELEPLVEGEPSDPTAVARLAELKARREQLLASCPPMLCVVTGPPRATRILPRGNWLDQSGPLVEPDTPAALPPLGVAGRRATRLDLARWLVDPEHPLTARVFVNRLWKLAFGRGLAATLDDLGTQGERPAHPELLDGLAREFVASGWDVKGMVRLLVASQAYRQSSHATPELDRFDPANRLWGRQNRWRLDAEMVRDNALSIGGLLANDVGGPSVKPYQPAGYWAHLNFPEREWQQDAGRQLYRRGLYTHWQRTFLHPSLKAFDAPSREECTAERPVSNTPQQALVLLNDPTYVEAARALAERMLREGGPRDADRIRWAFQQALARNPSPTEADRLEQLLMRSRIDYAGDLEAAAALTAVGSQPRGEEPPVAELAAWTSVARVILNLHETITRS